MARLTKKQYLEIVVKNFGPKTPVPQYLMTANDVLELMNEVDELRSQVKRPYCKKSTSRDIAVIKA